MRVLAVCGSLQAKSGNLELLKTAAAAVPPGVELVIFDGLRSLPHFNPDRGGRSARERDAMEVSGVRE